MFCRACGAHLDDNAKFCDKCGKETGKEAKRDDELVVEKAMKEIKKYVATESKEVVEVVKENRVILVKALMISDYYMWSFRKRIKDTTV